MKSGLVLELIAAHHSGDEARYALALRGLADSEEKMGHLSLATQLRQAQSSQTSLAWQPFSAQDWLTLPQTAVAAPAKTPFAQLKTDKLAKLAPDRLRQVLTQLAQLANSSELGLECADISFLLRLGWRETQSFLGHWSCSVLRLGAIDGPLSQALRIAQAFTYVIALPLTPEQGAAMKTRCREELLAQVAFASGSDELWLSLTEPMQTCQLLAYSQALQEQPEINELCLAKVWLELYRQANYSCGSLRSLVAGRHSEPAKWSAYHYLAQKGVPMRILAQISGLSESRLHYVLWKSRNYLT